jgi:thymidylate kinase
MVRGVAVETGPDVRPQVDTRPLTRAVLAALDEAGVRWSLVRGSPGGGDVDVLIAPADGGRAAEVMAAHGLVRLRAYGRGTHAFFLGLDHVTTSWVEFDVVTEVSFGRHVEFRTPAAAACLARRRRVAGVWVLAPEDEFWMLLLHCLLDKGAFADRHLRRLSMLAPVASFDSPLLHALPPGIPCDALLAHAQSHAWPALSALGPSVSRAWRRAAPVGVTLASAGAAGLRAIERPLQAWSRRGASVALLGPDGCGKSTLARGIASAFCFPVRTVYMGLWPTEDKEVGPVRSALRVARRPMVVWRRYLAALRHRVLGRLVLFDRYVYDARLPARGGLTWLKRPYFAMLSRCCPAPDLVVLLDAPGQVMHARSGEYDASHLEMERRQYARIAATLPRVVRVDANRPAEAVLRDAVGQVWRLYQTRITP